MARNDVQDTELLTSAEVCALFRVSDKTLGRWIQEDKIRPIKGIGRQRRFLKSTVDEKLQEATVDGQGQKAS